MRHLWRIKATEILQMTVSCRKFVENTNEILFVMGDEVNIYWSMKKIITFSCISIVFGAASVWMLSCDNLNAIETTAAWGGILLFGVGGLLVLVINIFNFASRQAAITICDDHVVVGYRNLYMRYVAKEYQYSELEGFRIVDIFGVKIIEAQTKSQGAPIQILTQDLLMKPDEICNLLNERLSRYKSRH